MNSPKVFCDVLLDTTLRRELEQGISPGVLLLPDGPPQSVLHAARPDPKFGDAEIAFGQPPVESILASKNLRWLQISSAGFTRYDTPEFRHAMRERGVIVTNSSRVYAEACAEHVLAFLLAQARQLPRALRSHCANGTSEWNTLRQNSVPLFGQRVLILGYGGIARRLIEMLKPLSMQIVAYRRKARGDEPVPIVTEEELPSTLAQADHVINILPDNAASQRWMNADRLAQLKPSAVFYNIGRGTTVDQEALVHVLENHLLAAAWLDVTDPEPLPENHPLRRVENCWITPHTAGGHQNEAQTLIRFFLQNFQRYTNGENLVDRVI